MKKNIVSFLSLLIVFTIVFTAGCGGGAKTLKSGLDLQTLADQLMQDIEYQDKDLGPLPEQLWDRYIEQVSRDDLKQCVLIAGGGATAEELALFEANDQAAAERVKKGMEERYDYFRNAYQNYTPEQLKNLEKPVLIMDGNYVFGVICRDNDKARDIVENWIKAQK